MNVGIIDADLLAKKEQRHPNLALMKLSAHWKDNGADVTLLHNFDSIDAYDRVFLSRVFTSTPVPNEVLKKRNIYYGGTGFDYHKTVCLPPNIEHTKPDYTLYDAFLLDKANNQANFEFSRFRNRYNMFIDYSIGFLTRGCFRHCPFCVNKSERRVRRHSPLMEFYDKDKPKLAFLDDNFFGYINWRDILETVLEVDKPYKFTQGLDIRLLDEDKITALVSSKYDSDYIFAFDHIEDAELIETKLRMLRNFTLHPAKFYVLVGYYGYDFQELLSGMKRVALLFKYRAIPYIMRYRTGTTTPETEIKAEADTEPYTILFNELSYWANQACLVKRMSFREYCMLLKEDTSRKKQGERLAVLMEQAERELPELTSLFDVKFPQ